MKCKSCKYDSGKNDTCVSCRIMIRHLAMKIYKHELLSKMCNTLLGIWIIFWSIVLLIALMVWKLKLI